jgi:hypothetical protein
MNMTTLPEGVTGSVHAQMNTTMLCQKPKYAHKNSNQDIKFLTGNFSLNPKTTAGVWNLPRIYSSLYW